MPFDHWVAPSPIPADAPTLHDDPLISELLYRRGVRAADQVGCFLDARPRPTPDPFRMPNMEHAVRRVCRAVETGERVGVFGDYDADGVTASAIVVRALRSALGRDRVAVRLPTRGEGYGLSRAGVQELADGGATLLITVDCGSSDHDEVAFARSLGLDVVVLDHHQMSDAGPDGAIVVSAKAPGAPADAYPDLAAAGIAFLLVSGMAREGCLADGGALEQDLLDLVALGIVGDVCPLTGHNRNLVRDGLRRIRRQPRPGLAALCGRAGVDPTTATASAIAYRLVPRLNAAGRIDDPRLALDLLLTEDRREAEALAAQLEAMNDLRKERGQAILAEAERALDARGDLDSRGLLVVAGEGWAGGVLGIAAAKLTERYGRPVIVLSTDGEMSRGSARSIPGFDINAALAQSGELLDQHGGHSQAAGLSLRSENIGRLEEALSEAVWASPVQAPLVPELRPDAVLPAARLNLGTARQLAVLEPHGRGNEQPLFLVEDARVVRYDAVGREKQHLKLFVDTGRGSAPVMAWNAAIRSRELMTASRIDLAVRMHVGSWNGQERLEAIAEDFRPSRI